MKKMNCNIANDLIPLYVDDILSEDSKEMLEEHIAKCEKCKQTIGKMRQDIPVMEDRNINPFKKLRKQIVIRTILIVLVLFGLYTAFLFCDLTVIPVFYAGDGLMDCMEVVETEEGLFLRRQDLAVRGDVIFVDDSNGEVKFYLGENIFGRLRMSWDETLTYTQIAPVEPAFGESPITKVSYCDKDGNVRYVLWEKE